MSPSPVDIGTFSFTGGTGPADSEALLQSIDVSSLALQIDEGDIVSSFSVLLQSRSISSGSDIGKATLSFLDGSNNVLLSEVFIDNPVQDVFDWNQFFDERIVPLNTRSIEIILDSSRNVGSSSDSYFDEVSLVVCQRNFAWFNRRRSRGDKYCLIGVKNCLIFDPG